MIRIYLPVILSVLILAGCAGTGRYELSKDNAGRLVRLDTKTGEITLIEGSELTAIKGSAVAAAPAKPQVTLPEGSKAWPTLTLTILGDISAVLVTSWQDGKLHYILELYPISKRLRLVHSGYYGESYFSMWLLDAAGKQLVRIDLPTNRLVREISASRNMEELSAKGDIPMTEAAYDNVGSWQLNWNP